MPRNSGNEGKREPIEIKRASEIASEEKMERTCHAAENAWQSAHRAARRVKWQLCARGDRVPKTNRDYWERKISRNRDRVLQGRPIIDLCFQFISRLNRAHPSGCSSQNYVTRQECERLINE